MSRALILGCSHAAGAEIGAEPGLEHLDYKQRAEYEAKHSFPWLIAQALGHDPSNYAISGGSNDAMFRIWLRERQHLTTSDIVIACWTGIDRREIYHERSGLWMQVTHNRIDNSQRRQDPWLLEYTPTPGVIADPMLAQAHPYFASLMLTREQGRINKLCNILALNSDARERGIQVINLDMFMPVEMIKDHTWPLGSDNFLHWAKQNHQPHTENGHYFAATHHLFAQHVLASMPR